MKDKNHSVGSVSLVIPIYNNGKTAEKQLSNCYKAIGDVCKKFEIIICNDASFDNTAAIIEKFKKDYHNVTILTHKNNKGIAPTLKELYKKAKMDYTLLFSVDGGWDTNDIKRLILKMREVNKDILIGKRTKKHYSFLRHVISKSYNLLPYILFQTKMYDVGSIKMFSTRLYRSISPISKSVFFEAEFLIRSRKKGASISYLGITHKNAKNKKSGVHVKIVINSFVDMIKLRLAI